MIKRMTALFLVSILFTFSFAQDKVTPVVKSIKATNDDGTRISNLISVEKPTGTAVLISKMWNAYTTQASYTNQIYFDAFSNLIAVIHRIDLTGAGSGRIVYNVSDDIGATWSPQIGPVNDPLYLNGRHPNLILSNPTHSSDPANVSALFGYYQVGTSTTFDIGVWGGDVLGNATPTLFAEANYWSVGDEAFVNNRGHGFFVTDLFATDAGVVQKLQKTTDVGATWSATPIGLAADYDNENWNGTKSDIASSGNGYIMVNAQPIGIPDYRFGLKATTDDGDTWEANWNWVDPYQASYLGGVLGDSVAALNYEVDFIVFGNNSPFFVGTFVDTLDGTATGVYVLSNTGSGWTAELMRLVNTQTIDLSGGLIALNEVEFARNENGSVLALKYCDLPTIADVNYDMFVRWFDGTSWSAEENITNSASINEVYSQTAPRLHFDGVDTYKLITMYTLFGATDLAEAELYFVDGVTKQITPPSDIPVTFSVDMGVQAFEGNFPAGATVVARGNFQVDAGDPGGNWQGNMFELSDGDGDTVYTGTFNIPASFAGTSYLFKYVIVNPPAGDNWESSADRPFILTAPATVLSTVWFNNDDVYTILTEVTNTLEFTADINTILGVGVGGAFDPNSDSLLVMGLDWDNLGKNVVGNRRLFNTDPFNTGIYTTTLTVTSGSAAPNGVGDSTKWKFRAFPDTRFANTGWETGTDRWHYYVADGSTVTLPVIIPNIYPLFGPLVNDVPMQFTVDLTGAVNKYNGLPLPLNEIEFVGIKGAAPFLGSWGGNWTVADTIGGDASTLKVMYSIGNNLWRYNVVVPAGTNSGAYEYKYAAMYPGADTVNGGSAPLDNEGAFGLNHLFILSDQPGINLWNIFGDFTTDIKTINDLLPVAYELGQNYPNPFNPTTTIKFSVPEAGLISLKVYNLLGQEVALLFDGEKPAGNYEATFDASVLASGIYFYTLEAKNFTSTRKMVLLK